MWGEERAAAPVAGKALEAGLVVLYVGLLTTALYGGAVPEYRTAAGQSVADRTLAAAAERIQDAVPPAARDVRARFEVALPDAIRGTAYRIRVDGPWLVLDHPHPEIGGRARLSLPGTVSRVEGAWHSTDPAVVRVETAETGLVVRLERGR